MAEKDFKSVKLSDFTRLAEARKENYENAEIRTLPPVDAYAPNVLAKRLHPDHMYLKVAKATKLQEGVYCYTMVPDENRGTKEIAYFYAGQYLSINLNIDGMPVTRAYSISSSPKMALEGKIEITVKAVPGGLVSNYIQANWKEGTEVDTSGPLGTFTYEGIRDAKTVIGIAGGSGITPFLSFARAIADGDEDFNLILLYGNRTYDTIVYREELDELAKKTEKVKVVYVLSDETKEGYEHGFISAELIQKYAPKDEEYSVFLCGPQAMYRFVGKELEKLHLRKKFIRQEMAGELLGPEKLPDYPDNVPETVTITVHQEGRTYKIQGSSKDSVLRILEKNKIAAPSHCRSGECGWCHSRLISGKVFCPKSVDGRREADLKFGYIHPCVSFPLGDLEIEVPIAK